MLRIVVVVLSSLVLLPDAWSGTVLAEEPTGGIEEIVVTARKRTESLETVPVSVTALSGDDLRAAQVRDIADLEQLVPNLRFRRGRSGTDANVYIRGVGTQGDDVFLDQAVGIYVDGVYLARTAGSVLDLLDFQQVEVLRGPQGTLFGKNTVGGAISISTVKPQPELGGSLMVRGGNFDLVETRATLNVPLGRGWLEDRLLSRFSFASTNTSGYTENTHLGVNWNDEDTVAFLGSLRFLPTDDITLDVSGTWSQTQGHGRGGECFLQRRSQFDGIPGDPPEEYYDYCRDEDRLTPFKFESDVDGLNDQESYGTWATLNWDLGDVWIADDVSLKLIGSWREQVQRLREDIDMSRFNLFRWSSTGTGEFGGDPGVANQGTVELQETASFWDDRLSLVSGAFFYWEHVSTEFDYRVFEESFISPAAGGLTKSEIKTDNFSWALFTHGVLDVTEWLSLTGGVRYTREEKGAARLLSNSAICESGASAPCSPDDPNDVLAGFDEDTRTFDAITPMASVALTMPDDWLGDAPIDHLMTYFTYSRGFKGGGINAAVRTMDEREIGDFDQETLDSFELGVKTVGFDRRLRASISGYYGLYDDLQLPTVVGGTCPADNPGCLPPPLYIVDNAGKATIAGAELEVSVHPIDGLDVMAAASYQYTRYDEYAGTDVLIDANDPDELPFLEIDRTGDRFPFVPVYSASMAIQYAQPVTVSGPECLDGTLTPRLDWSYRSSVRYWGRELSGNLQHGYHLLNARLGYVFWDDSLEVALWSRNLTDETYFDEVYQIPALVIGNISRFYGSPRTFGGEVTFRF